MMSRQALVWTERELDEANRADNIYVLAAVPSQHQSLLSGKRTQSHPNSPPSNTFGLPSTGAWEGQTGADETA